MNFAEVQVLMLLGSRRRRPPRRHGPSRRPEHCAFAADGRPPHNLRFTIVAILGSATLLQSSISRGRIWGSALPVRHPACEASGSAGTDWDGVVCWIVVVVDSPTWLRTCIYAVRRSHMERATPG
ncbi:hypothetical protein VFPBJ_09702 [Purpureocillium lilacinum]|uniref:Uncharacterized protein n=1 Tax=Purpureocillium lilacinum TaxID=33203 RepID=A0A179GF25_PURLI|nr:hypothetical protein VFPBJ_09702 [Purpureocillium lilacinum]